MPTIKEFEKLQVWQSARILVQLIYKVTKLSVFSKDFALRDQIRKASISVMSNIAEGLDAGYDNEFIRFLGYSFRSVAEVQSQLYTALDEKYITETEFHEAYDQGADIRKQIRGLTTYLANNKRPGRVIREDRTSYSIDGVDLISTTDLDLPPGFMAAD